MGVVCGAGEYVIAIGLTALILLVLVWERLPLVKRIGIVSKRIAEKEAEIAAADSAAIPRTEISVEVVENQP